MLGLVSPGYLASDYCRKELNLFYKKIGSEPAGKKIGDSSRILNVLLNNVHYNQRPEELRGATGFAFHDAADAEEFGDPLDIGNPAYIHQLKLLRDAIVQMFENFPKEETVANQNELAYEEEKKNRLLAKVKSGGIGINKGCNKGNPKSIARMAPVSVLQQFKHFCFCIDVLNPYPLFSMLPA